MSVNSKSMIKLFGTFDAYIVGDKHNIILLRKIVIGVA